MATAVEPKTRHMMAELNENGDTKITWDSDNADEVAAAKAQFDLLVGKKRFLAFTVKRNGEQGERITGFDPDAERIILVPQTVGG